MRYTPNGQEARDRSKVGMIFWRDPVKERVIVASAGNNRFTIPPGDPAYKVEASFTVKTPGTLLSLHPHMHLRGKADRNSTRLNSSHSQISYAVFCLKKKKKNHTNNSLPNTGRCSQQRGTSASLVISHIDPIVRTTSATDHAIV